MSKIELLRKLGIQRVDAQKYLMDAKTATPRRWQKDLKQWG